MSHDATTPRDEAKAQAPFAGLRVIELAEDIGGEFTGRLLAEMGADVVKLEPPGGSPTRQVGPFAKGVRSEDTSLNFWFYNSNKRSVVLDLRAPSGLARLRSLLQDADIFITTLKPAALREIGLDLAALREACPKLIVGSVTAFGLDGPWANYKSSDLVALALGGPLNSCGYDDHALPPIRPGGNQAYHTAMSFALLGLLLALLDRQQSGKGQLVDIAMHEGLALNVELANAYWFYARTNILRQTCRHAQPVATQPALFQCADGRYLYYALVIADHKPWQALVEWMDSKGMAGELTDAAFKDIKFRQQNFHRIQEVVECFFLVHDSREMYHEGQARGLPIGILNAPEDVFSDEHLEARGFFVDVEEEGVGTVRYPGPIYRFSSFSAVPRMRAPKLGEHTSQILGAAAAAE
jgi:benzylsuccinate CoA-transferase BbsE subunit